MLKLNSIGEVSEFDQNRIILESANDDITGADSLIPLQQFIAHQGLLADQPLRSVWINNDDDLEPLIPYLEQLDLIAINFPAFTDGRGFSLAAMIKAQSGFRGELMAAGHFMQDQLFYLRRCGFDSFLLQDETVNEAQLNSLKASLADFSETYQAAADQPLPLFRRRTL